MQSSILEQLEKKTFQPSWFKKLGHFLSNSPDDGPRVVEPFLISVLFCSIQNLVFWNH